MLLKKLTNKYKRHYQIIPLIHQNYNKKLPRPVIQEICLKAYKQSTLEKATIKTFNYVVSNCIHKLFFYGMCIHVYIEPIVCADGRKLGVTQFMKQRNLY